MNSDRAFADAENPSDGGRRRPSSLLRNGAAQSGNFVATYLLSFIAAPIVVAGLGIRAFGIWALSGALAQYGALIDLGVGRSLARYVAANRQDRRACGEYVAVALLGVGLVGAVLLLATYACAPVLAGALHRISTSDLRVVLASSVVVLTAAMLTSVISSYPIGLSRMVIPNLGRTAGSVVSFAASVGSIAAGAKLPGYAVANAAAGLVTVILVTAVVLIFEGRIPIALPGRARTADFLRYSTRTQVSWAMELVNFQSDKIVIALSVGPSAAGAYELANRVAAGARQVGILPSITMLPTITAELARHGVDYLRAAYQRFTEIAVLVAFPCLWLVAALSPLLLEAWLSAVPKDAALVLPALAVAYLASAAADLGKVVASAAGDLSVVAKTAVGTAAVNLALTAGLAPIFGLWGVLAGTIVALTGGALVQVTLVQRQFSLPRDSYMRAVLPSLRLCALLAVPIFVVSYAGFIHGRLLQAAAVVAMSVAYLVAYAVFLARSGRLPPQLVATAARWRLFHVAA